MRISMLVLVAALAACTKPNPNTCCVTEAQCAALGADETRPCAAGQACSPEFTCVAAQCETSADCTDPQAPICSVGLCVGTCRIDADCADVPGRTVCAPEGVCVGCFEASQCPASAAICDMGERACRGCELDEECTSGVCIEARGVCAELSEIIYVHMFGSDSGTCAEATPCQTLGYAVQQLRAGRQVIRLSGGTLTAESSPVSAPGAFVIDGTGTGVYKPTAGMPWLSLPVGSDVILEGVTVNGTNDVLDPAIVARGTLRLDRGMVLKGTVEATDATLILRHAVFESLLVTTRGTLDVEGVSFTSPTGTNLGIRGHDTLTKISRSTFTGSGSQLLGLGGGSVTVENSLFVQGYELADSINISGVAPQSRFEFNTVVNVAGIDSDGVALYCDATLIARNNVFAYRSAHPHAYTDTCRPEFSLYDDVVADLPAPESNNHVAPIQSFFVGLSQKDFHLSAGSPAREIADPMSTVSVDIEGNPRPRPTSTRSDVGAFEAP